MSTSVNRVALVSMHTSPAAIAGTGDAGGMNVVIRGAARELARLGVAVDLLTRADGAPSTRELFPGVTLRELAAGSPGVLRKEQLPAATDAFGEAVAELAREGAGYDVIHAHYWLSGLATLPVAIELGIPLVQSFHTLAAMKDRTAAPGSAPEPEQRALTERYLANQAAAIVAGSAAEVESLIDDVRAPADRIWVVPPGVDVERFRPMRPEGADLELRGALDIAADRAVIAVVGRIQPLKDQELAIRSLAAMRGVRPVLVIVGEPTPGAERYDHDLRMLAAELGVSADVRFSGALDRERLAELFALSDLTLVPSRSETFGLVALESAASGTPVLGFRGTGLVESVAEGVSGVLIDSRDPERWARSIEALLADRAGLDRYAVTARDHAEGFTWTAMAAALLGVYAGVLPPR